MRCPRRVLFDLLVAVAADRGLLVDPETDALQVTLLEVRRRQVLVAAGLPLTCPVCRRPASAGLAIPGRDGYGYCSTACRELEGARRRARLWTPDSARAPDRARAGRRLPAAARARRTSPISSSGPNPAPRPGTS